MEVYYKPNDIVWVKLGPFWWPGEVIDKTSVPGDLFESLKREPIAIVKFFDDEGYYEIVKTPEGIYPYNCEKKYDFIKKGMDAFRAKNPKLASFPKDVSAAEVKTGGNANILSDPAFTTERKRNYAAEIFGSPAVKRPRENIKGRSTKSEPLITHRRFLGYDDYEARILNPKSEETNSEEESTPTVVSKEDKKFTCPICQFSSDRLGILMKHTNCHVKDVSFQSRQPIKKPQKRKRRKALSDEELSGDEKKTKTKRKYTKKKVDESILADDERSENDASLVTDDSPKRKTTKKNEQPTVIGEKKDICNDIIADWDDESNHEEVSDETLNETQEKSEDLMNDSSLADSSYADSSFVLHRTGEDLDSTKIASEITEEHKDNTSTEEKTEKNTNKSCFDFDDDEEDTKIPDAASGRKIPRVIPISDRRKTFEFDDELIDEEEEKKKRQILEDSEELAKLTESSIEMDKETESFEKTYQSLMDSTENIDLPDVPNILKTEQNFHSAKTVKYPDKAEREFSDLIEAEVFEEKLEELEKKEVLDEKLEELEKTEVVEEKLDKSDNTEVVEEAKLAKPAEVVISVDEKCEQQSELVQSSLFDEELLDKELELTLFKSKTKRRSKNTKRGRKSTRPKLEVTESNIDALLLKQAKESENFKDETDSETSTIQVPLNTPSHSGEQKASGHDTTTEATEIQDVNYKQKVQEESNANNTVNVGHDEKINTEEILNEKKKDKKEDVEVLVENRNVETGQKFEESADISEEKTVLTEVSESSSTKDSLKMNENQAKINVEVAKNELNHVEGMIIVDQHQPETKRRKTSHGYSKSFENNDNSIQINRRGRSRDSKMEESASSLLECNSQKEQKKSGSCRKSSRWERKSLNKDKKTLDDETLLESIMPSPEEINTVILGTSYSKENITIPIDEHKTLPETNEQRIENLKSPASEVQEKHSSAVSVPSELPFIEQNLEAEETKNTVNEEDIISKKESNESKTNKNNQADESSSKKIEGTTEDHKSHHKSSKKEKRSSKSEKNESSHRSSRSGRRSSRHEKEKQESSQGRKSVSQDEISIKHPKENSNSKKSRSSTSKDSHNRSKENPINDQEDNTSQRSTGKDKKTGQSSQKRKASPVKDHVVDDQKEHISSSRSSRRHGSRSARSSKNSLKEPENKERKPTIGKEPENLLKTEEVVERSLSSHMKLAGPLIHDEVDPIKDLFFPSETIVKTREQKREELKSIFSFDYDEKDLKKRRTYGHKRKSKQEKTETESEVSQKDGIVTEEHINKTECQMLDVKSYSPPDLSKTCLIEKHTSVIHNMELPQGALIEDQGKNETADVMEKENSETTEQKEVCYMSEVQYIETIVHQEKSENNKTQNEKGILINVNQEDKLVELSENKEDFAPKHDKEHITYENSQTQPVNVDTKLNKTEVELTDSKQTKEVEKSPMTISKRNRKPSRWDQKEKSNKSGNQERKTRWDTVKNEVEDLFQRSNIETGKEAVESNENPEIDETSQKEMNEIFSEKESIDLAEKNAEQIELIFGTSPLPGFNENTLLVKEHSETVNDKKEFLSASEKMNDEGFPSEALSQNSSFENSSDLLESVESQVARITHYEEPNIEQEVSNEEKSDEHKKSGSIFDTPEKSEKSADSLEDRMVVETSSLPGSCSSQSEEITITTEPALKSKKVYLLTEKAKREKVEKQLDFPKEQSTSLQEHSVPSRSVEKTNEVATKLTNPKKRFVKSFEDFELNKQKEKSLETEKSNATEVKVETSSLTIGKSPIAFKLKKQFLSKISNVFDEEDDKKETKLLPKLKSAKNDEKFFSKKKDLNASDKIERDTAKSCQVSNSLESKIKKPEAQNVISKNVAEISQVPQLLLLNKSSAEIEELPLEQSSQDTDSKRSNNPELNVHVDSEKNSVECSVDPTQSDIGKHEELNKSTSVMVSESLDRQDNDIDISKTEIITKNFPLDENKKEETEYVSIDGNLTVVSEKELAEGQVEITANMPSKKPMTLLSFSMDFSDDSSDASFEAFRKEKILNITESLDAKNVGDDNKEKEVAFDKKKEQIIVNEKNNVTFNNEDKIGIVENEDNKLTDNDMEKDQGDNIKENRTVNIIVKEQKSNEIEKKHNLNETEKEQQTIDKIEEELGIVCTKKEQTNDNNDKEKTSVHIELLTVKEKQTVENENKLLSLDKYVIEEIKTSPNITTPHTVEEKKHIVENENKLLSSDENVIEEIKISPSTTTPHSDMKKEAQIEGIENVKKADCDILSLLSEVTTPIKSSESGAIKNKNKESPKKKNINTEDIPVINEPLVIYNTAKSSTVTDMCDLEDHIPSQIVCTKNALINEEVMKVAGINNEFPKESAIPKTEPEMSKLLSRLTSDRKEENNSKMREFDTGTLKSDQIISKNLLKSAIKSKSVNTNVIPAKSANKAIILSEKIIRHAREVMGAPGNITAKQFEDVEDIEPYVITKSSKIESKKDGTTGSQKVSTPSASKLAVTSPKQFIMNANKQVIGIKKSSGKAKILNQTIIRPAGETIQNKVLTATEDNVEFDINSMPIVLSDELLTPETLENIPIVLGEQAQKTIPANENMKIIIDKKAQNNSKATLKTVSMPSGSASPTVRMPIMKKTTPKILQTQKPSQKIIRQVTSTVGTKSGKFVVVSDSPNRPAQLMKKQPNLLRKTIPITSVASSTQSNPSESTGHKIMIFTNQQGKQQRLLLTPAQQKMFGMQLPGKTIVKSSAVAQKSQVAKVQTSTLASTSKLQLGQSIQSPKLVKTTTSQVASPHMKIVAPRKNQKVYVPGTQINKPPQQKTIVITNQHGQTVRKIQGTNDALLDKQVAEQLEAIKVSSMKAQQKQQEANVRATQANKTPTIPIRKSNVKRQEPKQQAVVSQTKPSYPSASTIAGHSRVIDQRVPPLTPIKQDKKPEDSLKQSTSNKPERPLHQIVIQDNLGNQTTITEGQILALPSETVDGQPQSYVLVTLDETGNITPLNNEALMSLDPSLAGMGGGDLSNIVLQMDAGTTNDNVKQTTPTTVQEKSKQEVKPPVTPPKPVQQVMASIEQTTTQVQVTCNINGESGQQLILTGDPVATQKFLDSLSDGSTDLSNILAGAEGNSFLIQADGQQILINTEPTEAPLLQHNTNIVEQQEQDNPMFSTHPIKNQDILAAALADTDVFQQEQVTSQGKLTHSQLSPGQTLFPMNVGNVLETSLTLNSPIMTPLEVPSTNSKRIPVEEADILTTRVPKNVDLPITITDPNITQTVSHQQVLMTGDLQGNLELSLPISETSMSVTSEMSSPSFVYSLPNLDVSEHAEISQKTFSSSMPLLTEDVEESSELVPVPPKSVTLQTSINLGTVVTSGVTKKINSERGNKQHIVESMSTRGMVSGGTFIEEGLCTLGAEMCSSLSEPPPEMFDIPLANDGINFLNNKSKEKSNLSTVESGLLTDDSSSEIPVQSQIVSSDSLQSSDSSSSVSQDKTL